MKQHLNYRVWQNMSGEEQQNYNALYDNFVKTTEKLNKLNKELEQSKFDLNFWYKEQECAKVRVGKNYPISIRTLKEKHEYYSPAMDHWDSDCLPSRTTLSYAMSLFYKELIKYGEKFHKKLKTEQRSINTELNTLALKFKNLEYDLNEKYKAMWFPVKVTIDTQYAKKHSIRTDEDDKTFALIDVNPHNEHKIQVDYYCGYSTIIDRKDCLNIETYPEEKLFDSACDEKYRNELKEYAKLYEEIRKE